MTADASKDPMSGSKSFDSLGHMAAASQAELDRFIFTVSHDLKSPLVTLQGFASLLERDYQAGRTDRLAEFVQHIKDGVAQMAHLIDDLLVLSRIGRVTQPPEPVDLSDLTRKILRLHQPQLHQARIDIEEQDEIPPVNVDKERMADVIERLITNAIVHGSTHPAPCIRFGGRMVDGEARFFVADNGPGIAPQYHQRIFELFERLDPQTEGTGAGLAIVKRTLEALGGRVWVESAPGQGATFWLAFPKNLVAESPRSQMEGTAR